MVGQCSAGKCFNSFGSGIGMFRFPKSAEWREQWRSFVAKSRSNPTWEPTDNSRLCEAHFRLPQWKKFRSALNSDAVPDKMCECVPEELPKKTKSIKEYVHHDHPYASYSPLSRRLENSEMGCPAQESPTNADKNKNSKKSKDNKKHSFPCPFFEGNYLEQQHRSKVVENFELKQQVCHLQTLVDKIEAAESCTIRASGVLQNLDVNARYSTEKWDKKFIKKGLQSWFACGGKRYQKASQLMERPMPSVRTLQRRIQHIKFNPGIQVEFVESLGQKMSTFTDDRDRDASILFDEMALAVRRDYDPGSKSIIGLSTVSGRETELATKAQVYMFSGARKKWKQIVGYHFLPNDGCGPFVGSVITELLHLAEKNSVNIICIVCDMGNRGTLSELGFKTTKYGMVFKICNPANPTKWLRCLPDPGHVMKSVKEGLVSNEVFILPDDIVKQHNLPSNRVELSHIIWFNDYQNDEDLKFAPRLQLKDIVSKHFRKMKASSAFHLWDHPVASGLKFLCVKGIVPVEYETTAWFIKLMNRFKELVTSRNPSVAFSLKVPQRYEEAILTLRTVAHVFKHMVVGDEGKWKPIQTHIIMICETILDLQEFLLKDRNYAFVFTARFSQDIVENQFSVVRMVHSKCSCLQAKYCLKHCAISQFQQQIKNGSYDFHSVDDCVDILLALEENELPSSPPLPPADVKLFVWASTVPPGAFHVGQEDIIYRISGFAVFSLIELGRLKCSDCIEALKHKGDVPHPCSVLLKMMNFKDGAQFEVKDEVFQLFRITDYNIRGWKPVLAKTQVDLTPVINNVILPSVAETSLCTCHDILEMLVRKYSIMKFKMTSKILQRLECEGKTLHFASPSLAGGYFVDSYDPNQYTKNKDKLKRVLM